MVERDSAHRKIEFPLAAARTGEASSTRDLKNPLTTEGSREVTQENTKKSEILQWLIKF